MNYYIYYCIVMSYEISAILRIIDIQNIFLKAGFYQKMQI